KSRGNVVNPNDFIDKYGADVFRMYLMFMGPYEMGGATGAIRALSALIDLQTKLTIPLKKIKDCSVARKLLLSLI
ncbi:MAG TPA: hypothetical protein VHO28_03855, partial [Ignavibacteriales bacterium]|nr:hypothetical protein [Ignavibacteriales bacterium]